MRGPTAKALGALVAYNAKACEEARNPVCVCACGGKYHGLKHPPSWVKATQIKLELELLGVTQEEIDFGRPGRADPDPHAR